MNKIAILCTGGTIAMRKTVSGLSPDANFPQRLRDWLHENNIYGCEIIAHEPALDSTSARPQTWLNLALHIEKLTEYKAVIVLHGTDTMVYSAVALERLVPNRMVILTGAQYPLGSENGDAEKNLVRSIYIAQKYQFNSAAIFFHHYLLKPKYTRKVHTTNYSAFYSPNSNYYGEFIDDDFKMYELPTNKNDLLELNNIELEEEIIGMLYLSPAMPESSYKPLLLDKKIKAVILHSFGTGNIPNNKILHETLIAAINRGVKIINCSQCIGGEVLQNVYSMGAGNLNIVSGLDLTPEFHYVNEYINIHWR